MIDWYVDVLDFTIVHLVEDHYHYCNVKNSQGILLGIADSKEMGVFPSERKIIQSFFNSKSKMCQNSLSI